MERGSKASLVSKLVTEDEDSPEKGEERETSRFELYSDAVFSILATISILPAMEGLKEGETFDPQDLILIILVYVFTFMLIERMYFQHLHVFTRLHKLSVVLHTLCTIHMVTIF